MIIATRYDERLLLAVRKFVTINCAYINENNTWKRHAVHDGTFLVGHDDIMVGGT